VNHKEYKSLDEKYFSQVLSKKGVLVDVKGMYRGKIKNLNYWSL
jgi:UDP-N-acetyl-D-glucosamine/UDP-N-acetyl-D-galactosamine dehydrogenase